MAVISARLLCLQTCNYNAVACKRSLSFRRKEKQSSSVHHVEHSNSNCSNLLKAIKHMILQYLSKAGAVNNYSVNTVHMFLKSVCRIFFSNHLRNETPSLSCRLEIIDVSKESIWFMRHSCCNLYSIQI